MSKGKKILWLATLAFAAIDGFLYVFFGTVGTSSSRS